jgi:ABC-type amino acid transport system permease subunit
MVENIGHIKNPLTVIAIFAALAEVSGTVVLPFLSDRTQEIYVWFLMGFPILLVCIFFLFFIKDIMFYMHLPIFKMTVLSKIYLRVLLEI